MVTEMMKIIRALRWIAVATAVGGCWPYGNEGAQYLHRSDTITLSAGNAKDVNAATHVIDPWPRYVGNRRIPANGERMVGAMQRYQGRQIGRGQPQTLGGAPGGAAGSPDASAPPAPSGPPVGAATPTLR
jgi:hypothetical protein